MFSNESCKNAKACRFCWMCRHICPVAGATGNEAWTPRVRGMLVSMMEDGTTMDESIAKAMYECSLCDACAHDCVTGFRPNVYIREARTMAAVEGVMPPEVQKCLTQLTEKGNISGSSISPAVEKALMELPEQADTLLFLGQTAAADGADTALAVISLLKKAGVSFTVLRQEPISGAFLSELLGYTGEAQEQARKTAARIRAAGTKTLVVLDPHDACIFRDQYVNWGLLPDVQIVSAVAYLSDLIQKERLFPKKTVRTVSLHDPCRLARGLGDTQSVRQIVSILGMELKELFLNGEMTRCCGGPVVNAHSPQVARAMAASRLEDAVRIGSDCVVTACPSCQVLMSAVGNGGVEVLDLFRLLDDHC